MSSSHFNKGSKNQQLQDSSVKARFIREMMQRATDTKTPKASRDRILSLISKELDKPNLTREDVVAIVEETVGKDDILKKGDVEKRVEDKPEDYDTSNKWFPKSYLNPSHLYQFLDSYNDDEILKGTCHPVDSGELDTINRICGTEVYDYQKHYQKILEHFDRLKKSFEKKFIDNKLLALIFTYLNGPNKWNSNIIINWALSDLREWTNKHPGIPPNLDPSLVEEYENIGFEFKSFNPKFKLLASDHIQTFGELTQYFKYLFHIRSDNSIKKICLTLDEKYDWSAKISFDYDSIKETIDLFTNVEKLIETYEALIKLILEVKDKNNLPKPEVVLGFVKEGANVKFSVWHKNTTYKHTLQDTLDRPGQVYKNLITNKLNGLCEFDVEANFGDEGSHNISIWNYEVWSKKKLTSKPIGNMEGVKYILTFKK